MHVATSRNCTHSFLDNPMSSLATHPADIHPSLEERTDSSLTTSKYPTAQVQANDPLLRNLRRVVSSLLGRCGLEEDPAEAKQQKLFELCESC